MRTVEVTVVAILLREDRARAMPSTYARVLHAVNDGHGFVIRGANLQPAPATVVAFADLAGDQLVGYAVFKFHLAADSVDDNTLLHNTLSIGCLL